MAADMTQIYEDFWNALGEQAAADNPWPEFTRLAAPFDGREHRVHQLGYEGALNVAVFTAPDYSTVGVHFSLGPRRDGSTDFMSEMEEALTILKPEIDGAMGSTGAFKTGRLSGNTGVNRRWLSYSIGVARGTPAAAYAGLVYILLKRARTLWDRSLQELAEHIDQGLPPADAADLVRGRSPKAALPAYAVLDQLRRGESIADLIARMQNVTATVPTESSGPAIGAATAPSPAAEPNQRTSEQLTLGTIYTRADLSKLFAITDATLKTGVFRPKGTSSVWLFITEDKQADRTPYRDRLVGDTMYWQGQTAGRTDPLIIDHQARSLELLVFYRKRKDEHPGAGFRYLGPFEYVSHSGSGPTSFVPERQSDPAITIAPEDADEEPFDPANVEDARERIGRSIAQRRGQRTFRNDLIAAYEGKCAITGCSILDVLEAAHIYPYRGPDTNRVSNGLLLRTDLHTLFDCGLVTIDAPSMTVLVAPHLRGTEYGSYHGRVLKVPQRTGHQPSEAALDMHRRTSGLVRERCGDEQLERVTLQDA